jgi:hypothetical protein
MKIKITTLLILGASLALLASPFVPYDNAKAPTLPLPVAYERAMDALGPATNEFHCVSASIQTSFSTDGEWYFTFYSTNSSPKPKWVTVEFNGKIHIEDISAR